MTIIVHLVIARSVSDEAIQFLSKLYGSLFPLSPARRAPARRRNKAWMPEKECHPTPPRYAVDPPLREGDSPSHRRHVLAVLDRQQDAGPIIEARTILFGPVVHALARGNFTLADERLTDRFAEFASAGFAVVSAAGTMRLRISKAS